MVRSKKKENGMKCYLFHFILVLTINYIKQYKLFKIYSSACMFHLIETILFLFQLYFNTTFTLHYTIKYHE